MSARSLADEMWEKRENVLKFAERQSLGALKSELVLGDSIIFTFERGTVHERLPANAVTEKHQWRQRP